MTTCASNIFYNLIFVFIAETFTSDGKQCFIVDQTRQIKQVLDAQV